MPAGFLQLDLALQRFREVDHEELAERDTQSDAGYRVEITFRPATHDLDASASPDFFTRFRYW